MAWYLFAGAAALLSAVVAIIEKNTLGFRDQSPLRFATMFAVLTATFSFVLVPFVDFSLPLRIYVVLFLTALTGSTIGFFLILSALETADISKVSPLRNLNPIFVAMLAFAFLGESLTWVQGAGISLTVVGAYVLEAEKVRNLLQPLKNIVKKYYARLILAAAFFYSVSSVLGKYLLRYMDPVTLLFFTQVFIAFNFVAAMLYRGSGGLVSRLKEGAVKVSKRWPWVLLAAFLTVTYRLLQMQAFSMAMVSLVIPIKRMNSLIATVLGGRLFEEEHLVRKSAACLVMIAGAYLVIVP